MHADGRHQGILSVPGHVSGGVAIGDPFLRMDGPAVFKFAVRVLADVADEVLVAAGMKAADIDWLIPHQANVRILQSTAEKAGSADGEVHCHRRAARQHLCRIDSAGA